MTQDDGITELAREIVTIGSGSGELHFKANYLSPNILTKFFIYFANPRAADYAPSAIYGANNVWDSNFKGVWHLPNGTILTVNDSTINAVNGTNNGATATSGKIDGGAAFNGSTQYITTANPTTVIDNWTMEGWVKPAALPQFAGIFYNGSDNLNGYGFNISNGGTVSGSKLGSLVGSISWLDSGYTFPSSGSWYWVIMKRESGTIKYYVNSSQTANTQTSTPLTPTTNLTIGKFNINAIFFNGSLDEMRISNVARNIDWINTQYNNQVNPSFFFSIGKAYSRPGLTKAYRNRYPLITGTNAPLGWVPGQKIGYRGS